jgi:hypothetical protein
MERDLLEIIPESSMEDFYPQPRNILDDVDNISTDTLSGNL